MLVMRALQHSQRISQPLVVRDKPPRLSSGIVVLGGDPYGAAIKSGRQQLPFCDPGR